MCRAHGWACGSNFEPAGTLECDGRLEKMGLKRQIPAPYQRYLGTRHQSILEGEGQQRLTLRGFWVGGFLSFFLAIGAPYSNMILRGTFMSLDFSTPGAIFLFLFLIGVLNLLFKLAGRGKSAALLFALATALIWLYNYWPLNQLDPYSPGLIFSTFLLISAALNIPVVQGGGNLALNRSELILVYVMLLIVSALCTMGLSEQILPIITAIFYYASPQNKWQEKLFPHFPDKQILVQDGTGNKLFYEGITEAGQGIPYSAWAEPLFWWGLFLLALYVSMVSVAVILRRQWMERERLAYPVAQVGLAMIRGEERKSLVNEFFKEPSMWVGCAIPVLLGSLRALSRYDPAIAAPSLSWNIPLVGRQILQLNIDFAILGFSYLINANIAAGICFFHLLAKFEKELFFFIGLKSDQKMIFGVNDLPFLSYQGVGALIGMVLLGLWIGREHLGKVFLKAVGRAPEIDDGDEILSYRSAAIGTVGGGLVMVWWLWAMGTPMWIGLVFVVAAMLIFIGITRIVAEAGLIKLRSPMIAPDLVIQGLGSSLVGPTGVFNLSLAYFWAADIQVFVMATCSNGLKMIEEMPRWNRRLVFWAIILALLIGALGSFWMIFYLAYRDGGINLNSYFFKGLPETAYDNAVRNIDPAGVYWPGWFFFCGGGVAMVLMMMARQRLPWWPVHPIGFPIGANYMMNFVWFNVFLAWLIKTLVLRYGGAPLYRRSQTFFLGLISGQFLCNGSWLIIDYFVKVGNTL